MDRLPGSAAVLPASSWVPSNSSDDCLLCSWALWGCARSRRDTSWQHMFSGPMPYFLIPNKWLLTVAVAIVAAECAEQQQKAVMYISI